MADKLAQLEACKAAASNYRSHLQTAATKNEALTLTISAAENLMNALKVSSDPEERKQLKSQCTAMMNTADRIKKSSDWKPVIKEHVPINHHERIDQWAADVAVSASSATAFEDIASRSSSSSYNFSLNSAPVQNASLDNSKGQPHWTGSNTSRISPLPLNRHDHQNKPLPGAAFDISRKTTPSNKAGRAGLSLSPSSGANESRGYDSYTPESPLTVRPSRYTSSIPMTASASRSRKLAEPVSKRKRSKREEIILLKASVVNEFKCPPWTEPPKSAEFTMKDGEDLFLDTHDLSLSSYQQQFFKEWVRARDAMPPSWTKAVEGVDNTPLMSSSESIDLVQDAATDCSVVTSLCAGIARSERGHDEILTNKLYPFDTKLDRPVLTSNGKYVVRLNFNGCWRKVVIDDRLPVSTTHRLLHAIDRRNQRLLWPALLEKAYLKIRGGYDFPGSNSCSDLWVLTGWIPEQAFLQETDTIPDDLWNRIYNAFLYGDVLVTAGTGKMSSRQERELGLEGQHSYAVLDMKQTDQDRLLLVKNPWLEGKGWRGTRPSAAIALDSSLPSDRSQYNAASYHKDSVPTDARPHPTTFWIGLEQVIQHFESLYLNWNPGLFTHRQDIHFEWNIDAPSRGGCIIEHPQFALAPKGDAGRVWLLLSRHFRDVATDTKDISNALDDGIAGHELQINSSGEFSGGYMSISVCNGNGQRIFMKDTYLESSDYVTTPQCLLQWDADANSTYTIVVDQEDLTSSLHTFTLTAFSRFPLTLEPAAHKYAQQNLEKGAWTRQSAGGDTSSPKYFENPQYSLEIRQRGPLAILLMSDNHEHPMHVKLALGHGKRLYRLQSRDVLVDSGDHRNGCTFAEIQDLQPGLYTVICSLFEAGQTGNYTLRLDSTNIIGLKPIPREGAGLLSMKLAPACFRANIHKVAAPLLPRRLASYTIIARFMKATSPRWADLGKLARSPLRLSVEIGRGPERKFIVASELGEYTDAATVRSESVNIDPTFLGQGDIYLVLDRLSGPGGPVEEWYEVEIYTDMPQAYEIGVWREWDD